MLPLLFIFSFWIISGESNECKDKLSIKKLVVPEAIQYGSTESILLDCIYCYDEENDSRLVIKWFFNNEKEPIYQWIPELNLRTTSKRLEGRINMNFSINPSSKFTKYRAINIIRPTIELSGEYSCTVSTPESEDSKTSSMLVYALPKSIEFNYTFESKEMTSALRKTRGESKEENNNQHINNGYENASPSNLLRCDINGVYPMPEVITYRVSDEKGTNPSALPVVDYKSEQTSDSAFNIRTISSINVDNDLLRKYGHKPSIYECLVTLHLPNNIKITQRRKIHSHLAFNNLKIGRHKLDSTINESRSKKCNVTFIFLGFLLFIYSYYFTNRKVLYIRSFQNLVNTRHKSQ